MPGTNPKSKGPNYNTAHVRGLAAANARRSMTVARAKHDEAVQTQKSVTGRPHAVIGQVFLGTTGETIVDISFPVRFLERPVFTPGGQLGEGSRLTRGAFPVVNAVVLSYETDTKADEGVVSGPAKYYTGAKLGITAQGLSDQSFYLDYRFEGTALVNPTGQLADDTLDDEI